MTGVKRFFLRFEENLAALCLGGLLVTLFLQVFTRFITRDPLSWTEEAARYLYVYVVFLGSSAAVSDRTHVAIDFLVLRLPRWARLAVALLVNLACSSCWPTSSTGGSARPSASSTSRWSSSTFPMRGSTSWCRRQPS